MCRRLGEAEPCSLLQDHQGSSSKMVSHFSVDHSFPKPSWARRKDLTKLESKSHRYFSYREIWVCLKTIHLARMGLYYACEQTLNSLVDRHMHDWKDSDMNSGQAFFEELLCIE